MFLSFVRLSTTQGFVSFLLRRVSQFVVSAFFPAATQGFLLFCLRRGRSGRPERQHSYQSSRKCVRSA